MNMKISSLARRQRSPRPERQTSRSMLRPNNRGAPLRFCAKTYRMAKSSSSLAKLINVHCQYETVHYVKIAMASLKNELSIYEWRMRCEGSIQPIQEYRLVAQGTAQNPYAVVKVILRKTGEKMNTIHNSSLNKTIQLLAAALETAEILVQRFAPFRFTDENILISEQKGVLIWPCLPIEVNPTNSFYHKSSVPTKVTEQTMLSTLIDIFEEKSLKNKLLASFFKELRKSISLSGCRKRIELFKEDNCIYSPMRASKHTISTANPKSSTCLSFSKVPSRRKIRKLNKSPSQRSPFRSLQNISRDASESKDCTRNTDRNQSRLNGGYLTLKKTNSAFLYPSRKSKQQTSIVLSECLKDEEQMEEASISQTKGGLLFKDILQSHNYLSNYNSSQVSSSIIPEVVEPPNDLSIIIDKTVMDCERNKMLVSQFLEQQEQEDKVDSLSLLQRNGWVNVFTGFSNTPNKQSFCDGAEQNQCLQGIDLKLLNRMGREIGRSFLPVVEEPLEES